MNPVSICSSTLYFIIINVQTQCYFDEYPATNIFFYMKPTIKNFKIGGYYEKKKF